MTSFQLTSAQSRMWFHHVLRPSDTAYNVVAALHFDRPLDRDVLEKACRLLVRQNPILRTGFRLAASGPIASEEGEDFAADVRWTERPIDEADPLGFAQRLCDQADRSPFELARGRPPMWFELLGRKSAAEGMLICQHHIITDGSSLQLLYDQLQRQYAAVLAGQSLSAAPAGRFADYAREEARQNHSPALDYWRGALAGAPTLDLPFARTRPSEQTFRGKSIHGAFDPETEKALYAYAALAQTTPFTLQFSLVGALLARLAEQEDFIIGTPYVNRGPDIWQDVLGLFVNSIALRQNFAGDPDLATLVKRARGTLSDGLSHADAPIEKVVEALGLPPAVSHNPLFQVLVANQSWAAEAPVFAGVPSRHILARSMATRFDLEWTFFPQELERGFRLTWNTDILADEHVAALRDFLIRFARQWLAAPGKRLSELELSPLASAQGLIRRHPRPLPKASLSLAEAFTLQANETPDRIAVSSSQARHAYREVEHAATRLAGVLRAETGGRRLSIATLIDREPLLLTAFLAIFKAECALVPLDPRQPAARRRMMLTDAKAAWIIVSGDTHDLDEVARPVGIIDITAVLAGGVPEVRRRAPAEESGLPVDTAYVLYTSGTTGMPKGVVVRHPNVMNTLLGAGEAFGFDADDVFAVFAPVGFDIFFFELFSTLLVGGEAHLVSHDDWLDGNRLPRVFERATCLQAVPGLMTSILDQIELGGPHTAMRQVTTGGDRVPPALLARLVRAFPNAEISVTYGPTETAILASRHVVDGDIADYPIGQALPNVSLLVADKHGRIVPDGVEGELWIGGAGVAWGYLNRPEETADRFVAAFGDRYYRTGDRCRWDLAGVLQFRGRRDSQTKIRGFRVELGEIEARMAEHPCVRSAVAITSAADAGDVKLLACYVRQPHASSGHSQRTDEWNQIFDFIHEGDESMFAGWHDSVEGKPLPEEEMASWRQATVARLNALIDRRATTKSARVLEIGCGTGLLLFELAPKCAHYNATDFSPALVERLRRRCAAQGLTNCDVVIAQADEASFSGQTHDLVILNSVAQYFPGSEYFQTALRAAWDRVARGGVLFLGDVRSLVLHETFMREVASSKAKRFGSSSIGELLRLRAQENELLIHPAGLAQLAGGLPDFGGIHVSPKCEGAPNEVTRFRFDAAIRKGEPLPVLPTEWIDQRTWTLGEIEALARRSLAENRPIGAKGIPNDWIAARTPQDDALNPASVARAAGATGAGCFLSWQSARANGEFDAAFGSFREAFAIPFPGGSASDPPLTNLPTSRRILAEEAASIRAHLKAGMPTYMTPGLIVPISEIPLTTHGKVDRAALQVSQNFHGANGQDPPRTEVEKRVALIWQDILGLAETPDRRDNFFHLGGTSLIAIRLATKLRADGFSLRPQVIFTNQTLAELSAALTGTDAARRQDQPKSNGRAERLPDPKTSSDAPNHSPWPGFLPRTRVMLTGATGFLGIHLLRELLGREGVEIICPLRASGGLEVSARLGTVYHWYFGEELEAAAQGRVTAFPADLANGPLTWLASPPPFAPDLIIHAAADVRHLAAVDAIHRANVNGVEAALSLARDHAAALHHISSIGVAGVWPHPSSPPILRETDLEVGQELTEAYSESKFAAERLVRSFQAAGGKAIIYRAGTIAPHSRTGRFQQRFDAHFLTRQIKACIALGAAPARAGRRLSLVPVDIMAGWIMRLAEAASSSATYHLQAQTELSYPDFYNLLRAAGYHIDILSDQAFKVRLFEAMADPKLHDSVGVFLKTVEGGEMAVPLDSTRSFERLSALGARSVKITQSWMYSFLADSIARGCLHSPLAGTAG